MMPSDTRLQNFRNLPPILLHCGKEIGHEVFHRWCDSASQPDRGLAALSFRVAVGRGLFALCALSAGRDASAADTTVQLVGKGVQIYTCSKAPQSFAWRLKAPDAKLFDASGALAGHHFAGPTWQAVDGSTVVGSIVASSPAPQAASIPWLILAVKSRTGAGRFANIAYVVRSQTEGGSAPLSGCDATHAGIETRVAYQATYIFFPTAPTP